MTFQSHSLVQPFTTVSKKPVYPPLPQKDECFPHAFHPQHLIIKISKLAKKFKEFYSDHIGSTPNILLPIPNILLPRLYHESTSPSFHLFTRLSFDALQRKLPALLAAS